MTKLLKNYDDLSSLNGEEIISRYGHLVKTAVKQIRFDKLPVIIDKSDLLQEGYVELLRCAKSFKSQGAKFETYVDKCIRPHLIKIIVEARWGPKSTHYFRLKEKGIISLDMISYDGFNSNSLEEDDESQWIEEVPSKEGEEYDSAAIFKSIADKDKIIARVKKAISGGTINQDCNKFQIRFLINGKRITLSGFDSPEEIDKWRHYGFENILDMING